MSTEIEKVHQPSVIVAEIDYDRRKVPLSQLAATPLHSAIPSQRGPHLLDQYTSQTTNWGEPERAPHWSVVFVYVGASCFARSVNKKIR